MWVLDNVLGSNLSFRAVGLRSLVGVLRMMFWFGDLVFNALDMEDYEDEIEIEIGDVNEIGIVTGTEMEPC